MSLHKEVEYIRSYIDLQTMRFGDTVKILFMVQPGNYSHCIEPMLLNMEVKGKKAAVIYKLNLYVFGVFDLLPLYDPYDDPELWESFE